MAENLRTVRDCALAIHAIASELRTVNKRLDALENAPAPKAKAAEPVREVKSSKKGSRRTVKCAIHRKNVCNRRFSPNSSGVSNHQPRLISR